MAFSRCGRPDPFTSRVRTLYRANVLSAPRVGIEPLEVLAVHKRHVEARGRLPGLLSGDVVDLPAPADHPVADLAGLRSAGLDLGIGMKLTATFLAAIGLPIPGAEVTASLWSGASSIDFEVRDVSERRVDLALLGKALAGRTIDENPATAVFLTDRTIRMLVITRTFVSRHFAVHATGHSGQSADVSVDAIEKLIGRSTASVGWKRESAETVSFQGDTAVTFAFAAVPCALQPDRSIVFGVEVDELTFGAGGAPPAVKPVVDEDGLLSFDDIAVAGAE